MQSRVYISHCFASKQSKQIQDHVDKIFARNTQQKWMRYDFQNPHISFGSHNSNVSQLYMASQFHSGCLKFSFYISTSFHQCFALTVTTDIYSPYRDRKGESRASLSKATWRHLNLTQTQTIIKQQSFQILEGAIGITA